MDIIITDDNIMCLYNILIYVILFANKHELCTVLKDDIYFSHISREGGAEYVLILEDNLLLIPR